MDQDRRLTKLDYATWGAFMIFAVTAVIVAVTLPEISATFDTNLSEGGGLETARSLLIFVVLFLAGLVAQRWGKKRFLVLGQYLMFAGLFLASIAANYEMLVLTVMLMGVGGGFSEALLNPLLVDIHESESGRYLNLSHAFYPLGIVVAAVLFGELLTLGVSWRVTFQIAAAGALVIALSFTVLPFPPAREDGRPGSYSRQFVGILSLGGFWLFAAALFLAGGAEAALTFWSRSYVEAYLSDVPRVGAFAVAIFAGAMFFGRLITAYLANRFSLNSIMIGSAVLGAVVSFLLPGATSLTPFYGLLALAGFATACFWPTILAEADAFLDVNTTILFVALACGGIIGFGVTPWLMGLVGDSSGLRAAFNVIPFMFGALLLVLLVVHRLGQRAAMPQQT